MRDYYIRRRPQMDYEWWDLPNTESTSRTVWESEELIDTGLLDEAGNKIMAKERKQQIGFVKLR